MPTFNDSENRLFMVPAGDYKFEVVRYEKAISAGANTRGSDTHKLRLELTTPDGQKSTMFDDLIDHPTCAWKLDCFLKCAGVTLAKGAAYEFDAQEAEAAGVPFIDPIGLRGWCHVVVDKYKDKPERNKVSVYYTNKEKLPRAERKPPEAPTQTSEDDDIPF